MVKIMKKLLKNSFRVYFLLIAIFFLNVSFIKAEAGVPSLLSYQGHLSDSGGNPLGGTGANYYFKFSLWDNPVVGSGSKVWPANPSGVSTLQVKQGLFSVNIGDTDNGFPDALNYNFANNKNVYLQVEISSDNVIFETLTPRSTITASAFSRVSGQVSGVGQSSIGTTTALSGSVLTVSSTSTNSTALSILGISGQGANLLNVLDSALNSLFSVGPTGAITASSSLAVYGPVNFYNTLNAGASTFSSLTLGSSGPFTSLLGSGLSNVSGVLTVSSSTIQGLFSALGAGLSYSPLTGAFTNTGVTALAGTSNQINVSGMTGAVTLSLPQDINTVSSPTFAGLGIGTNSLSSNKFKVTLSSGSVSDNFNNQNYIASKNNVTVSSGLALTQAVCGAYTVPGNADGLTYGTVVGADGNCWLDRNLGAARVANAYNDYLAYGSLFQWGRLTDGHQQINWTSSTAGTPVYSTTASLSGTDNPGTNLFITNNGGTYDWRNPQNNSLWQGVSGTNNVCPTGFRLPTQTEWSNLVTVAGITNYTTAYSSSLKLVVAGYRGGSSGSLTNQGSYGGYWSSSVTGSNAYDLAFLSSSVFPAYYSNRTLGFSVRCLKN